MHPFAMIAAALAAASFSALGADISAKTRVAVLDFDNVAVQKSANPYLQSAGSNLGKAAADLLINRLVADTACSVIERGALDKLIAEQNFSNSDRTDPITAATLGKVLGVDAMVLGSITRYDRDDKTSNKGGLSIGGFGSRMPKTNHDIKAFVQINARIISPNTAEVLAVAQGSAEMKRKTTSSGYSGMGTIAVLTGAGGNDPLLNEAMDQAVKALAADIERNLSKVPPRSTMIDGLVAAAKPSGQLILNVGSRAGVKSGDHLQIRRLGDVIRDPTTGKILRWDDALIGEVVVTEVDEVSAGAVFNGSEAPKVGDRVVSLPKP